MQNYPSGPNDPTYTPQPYPPTVPPPPPPKKRRTWLWIVLGVFAVLVLGCVGLVAIASQAGQSGTQPQATQAGNTPATGNTPAPTTAPATWKTLKTFKGNGSKKTGVFSVPSDWRVAWTCKPGSFDGIDYNVIIDVYNSDGTIVDQAVNTTCKKGNSSDVSEEHQSGDVYLDITSEGDWVITVQTLQ